MTSLEHHLAVVSRHDTVGATMALALAGLDLGAAARARLRDAIDPALDLVASGQARAEPMLLAAAVRTDVGLADRVAAMARDPGHPSAEVATVALSQVGDSRALPGLRALVRKTGGATWVWRALASIPDPSGDLEDMGRAPAPELEARMLRAVVLARGGDAGPILDWVAATARMLGGETEHEPSWLDGDPLLVRAGLIALPPLPDPVRVRLLALDSGQLDPALAAVVEGLSAVTDQHHDRDPEFRSGPWATGRAPTEMELEHLQTDPWETAGGARLRLFGTVSLADAPPGTVEAILEAAVTRPPDGPAPAEIGNALVELVDVLDRPLRPNVGLLISRGRSAMPMEQLGWILSRVPANDLIEDPWTWPAARAEIVAACLLAAAQAPAEPVYLGGGGTPSPVTWPDGPPAAAEPQAMPPPQQAPSPADDEPRGGGPLRALRRILRRSPEQPDTARPTPDGPPPVASGTGPGPAPANAEEADAPPPETRAESGQVTKPRPKQTQALNSASGRRGRQPNRHGPQPRAATPPTAAASAPPDTSSEATSRTGWPRIDAPRTVAPGVAFPLTVGLRATAQAEVSTPGPVVLPPGPVELDVTVLADGFALLPRPDGSGASWQVRLHVDDATPYPSATLDLVAVQRDDLGGDRTVGVTFAVNGSVVGMATRTIRVTTQSSTAPPDEEPLAPEPALTLPATPPGGGTADLTITITRGDDTAGRHLILDVWSSLVDLPHPPTENTDRTFDVGTDPEAFLRQLMREMESDATPQQLLEYVRGTGMRIGNMLPAFVVAAIRKVLDAAAAAGSDAPTVLVLTQDAYVPWELTRLTDPDGRRWFLAERAAVGRWPYGRPPPDPAPPTRTQVVAAGTITAVYDGVDEWQRLPSAEEEVEDLAARLGDVNRIEPTWDAVRAALNGSPAVDLLHVALHGRHVQGESRSGLVLLRNAPQPAMPPVEDFLQPTHVLEWDLSTKHPLVFLNACQVGAAGEVLGNASGLAVELARIGASAVIAPLWSINDVHARTTARAFYDAAADGAVPGPEVLRRRRAAVTDDAVADPERGRGALTDLAYQFWGAPDHRLTLPPRPAASPH